MVTVKPANADAVAEICARLNLPCAQGTLAMVATVGSEYVGAAVFTLTEQMQLKFVDYTAGDDGLADLITRATMNYAINRQIDRCEFGPMCPLETFVKLGFIDTPLPQDVSIIGIFSGCKHCGGH